MGAHSGNAHKAIPTEMPDTKFELHQTNISAPPSPLTPIPTLHTSSFSTPYPPSIPPRAYRCTAASSPGT